MNHLAFIAIGLLLFSNGCKETTEHVLPCMEITEGTPFEAKVHDTWCLPDESVKITFGPILDDSRCNIPNIECVWAGQTLLELRIETTEIPNTYLDTLFAVNNWQDTISIGNYNLQLNRVFPLERSGFDVDTANYRFQMILNQ